MTSAPSPHSSSAVPGAVASEESFDGLRIRGISKTFGANTTVLREIDLDVRPGEMISLVGSSGTGKSHYCWARGSDDGSGNLRRSASGTRFGGCGLPVPDSVPAPEREG